MNTPISEADIVERLSALDSRKDIYPDDDTRIRLYGEAHGKKVYYDIEFELWKECSTW